MTKISTFLTVLATALLGQACAHVSSSRPAAASTPVPGATPHDVWLVLSQSNCGGCHTSDNARQGLGHFTIDSEAEFYKALAYHTEAMREEIVPVDGEDALNAVPWLKIPLINPHEPHNDERFIDRIQRDGQIFGEADRLVLSQWIAQGAPLPEDSFQEAMGEVRQIIGRQRP